MAEHRHEMDLRMATVLANHQTILTNQDFVIGQLAHQHDCLERLKVAVGANSEISEEVKALLSTFKIMGGVTKWLAVTGAALVSLWHAVKAWVAFWR